ncbi:hypothetical protein [Vibrio paucivorans]
MTACASGSAFSAERNRSFEAGATLVGDQTLATLGYSHEIGNNIVAGGGFSFGTEAVEFEEPNDQDAWGLYANIGYKFQIAEFDIIPKVGINYLNADVEFEDSSMADFNLDNVYPSVGGTVNWRMIGLTVDYGKLSETYNDQDIEEDVVRVTASVNF